MTSCIFSPSVLSSFWCDAVFSITPPILFAIKSSILSFLVIVTNDILVTRFEAISIYGNSYRESFTPKLNYFHWVFGCFVVAFLLRLTDVISATNQSALTVSIAWPFMFAKFGNVIDRDDDGDDIGEDK